MKTRAWFAVLAALFGLAASGPWPAGPAWAADFQIGAISINAPWSRASLRERGVVSVYMTVTNTAEADRLIKATSPMAEEIEFREIVVISVVIRSARLSGVNIPPGTHSFNPQGAHLLLLRANAVAEGSVIPLVLTL